MTIVIINYHCRAHLTHESWLGLRSLCAPHHDGGMLSPDPLINQVLLLIDVRLDIVVGLDTLSR